MTNPFDYNFKFNLIRKYVNFSFDRRKNLNNLSKKDKQLITRYYNTLVHDIAKVSVDKNNNPKIKLKSGSIYRPRKKENLKIAVNALNKNIPLKHLKAVPIADIKRKDGTIIKRKIKITKSKKAKIFRNGEPLILLELDPIAMLEDPEKELNKVLKHYHGYDFYYFAIYGNKLPQATRSIDGLLIIYNNITNAYQPEKINGVFCIKAVK